MKDTIITAKQKKRELFILLLCFLFAYVFNVIAILKFEAPAKELLTQLHIVLLLTVVFYIILLFVRILRWLIIKAFKKSTVL